MNDLNQLQRDIREWYASRSTSDLQQKIADLIVYLREEYGLDEQNLTQQELYIMVDTALKAQTAAAQTELESLLVQHERIERQIERKSDELQQQKQDVFQAIEARLSTAPENVQVKLHHVKLQSIDLFDMLEEIIESAIITTLEKNHEIEETIEEITKEVTHETLSEGPLEPDRIRLVIGAILHRAVEVSEATPNQAEAILRGTLKGVRSGLIKSIRRLKKQLLYMPEELGLTENMERELLRSDVLFTQILQNEELQCSAESRSLLEKLTKGIRYDLEELVEVSKETVELMRDQLSKALSRSQMLNSKAANDAKRIGISAWRSAKTALEGALQNAKDKIDKK